MDIILASGSPRRSQLLKELGFDFRIETRSIDESFPMDMNAMEVAGYLAVQKSNAFAGDYESSCVITADTVVICDGKVLGKPADAVEAKSMILSFSGKKHYVVSAVCVRYNGKSEVLTDAAEVHFDVITEAEADFYIEQYKPYDKAGSYAIQEWIGQAKITKINGSFYTIMGLPTHLLYKYLHQVG